MRQTVNDARQPPGPTTSPRRRRAPKGQGALLRDEILSAADRLLTERGHPDAVSVAAIAEAVGVSPPSIYMHFEDKDSLIRAVARAEFETLGDIIDAAIAHMDDPMEMLCTRLRTYVQFGLSRPHHFAILFMGSRIDLRNGCDVGALPRTPSFEAMIDNVRLCIASGRLAGDDPVLVTCVLWAAVHGVVTLGIGFRGFPLAGTLDEILDVTLGALTRGLHPGTRPAPAVT